MRIIGLSAYYHDSAAALIEDGTIIAAAQEERFTRKKNDADFPVNALHYCLEESKFSPDSINYVVFYDKPFLKFERILETYFAFAPRGFNSFRHGLPVWAKEKLFQRSLLHKQLCTINPAFKNTPILFSEHHLSHAASAFYPSPFEDAAILTMDGVGEWTTTSVAIGNGRDLKITREINFPHSLGLLYSAFTAYAGFKVNSGEYKLMGLAPYGEPLFADLIKNNLIDIKPDGSFRLDQRYFNYSTGTSMTSRHFHKLFGRPPRQQGDSLDQFHADIAASVQSVTETVVLSLTRDIARQTGKRHLCLAGGVALNCVANGKVLRDGAFENIWIQPASGDAGGALGAALAAYYLHAKQPRTPQPNDSMQGGLLGPAYSQHFIEQELEAVEAKYDVLNDDELLDYTVTALINEKVVGWFQGRMEYGPRALGSRSILADPRSGKMQKLLNMKIKFRESFRPFAPAVLEEDAKDWFDLQSTSPYMLLVSEVKANHRTISEDEAARVKGLENQHVRRSTIPAVTHVDFSARVQTVGHEYNKKYRSLLQRFKDRTGCPMLINTSFNIRGEPIICSPRDAFRCFMGTDMDVMVVGNCFLRKENQLEKNVRNYFNPAAED